MSEPAAAETEEEQRDPMCLAFEHGYGTDGGGYEFERGILRGLAVLSYDGDPEYLGVVGELRSHEVELVLASPHSCPLPGMFIDDGGQLHIALADCVGVADTDRECHCHGHIPCTLEYEKLHGPWVFTGNALDEAWPDCPRCEGSGYVESPRCTMRAYRQEWYAEDYPVLDGLRFLACLALGHVVSAPEPD